MNILLAVAFLFLKTGEKFATQESAGPTVAGLTSSLGAYEPQVLNDPVKAVEFCAAKKPAVGIVTPGFFLAYNRALGMEPVLETRRQNVLAERYVLVTGKNAGDDLHGRIIATVLMEEGAWKALSADEELGPKLKAAFTSEELPRDLVVIFRPNAGSLDIEKLKTALKQTDKQILSSIRVEAFVDVDKERLSKAEALYRAK
jgi:hypothetical protein